MTPTLICAGACMAKPPKRQTRLNKQRVLTKRMVDLRRNCNQAALFGVMLRETRDGVRLAVRAQPGAKRTAIVGVYGEGAAAQLKITVQAPPVEGRANEALVAFLAQMFSVPKSAVELVSGESSRSKVFLLRGIKVPQVRSALNMDMT